MRRAVFAVVLALLAAVGCSSTVVLGSVPLEINDLAQPRFDISFVDAFFPGDALFDAAPSDGPFDLSPQTDL